MNLNSSLLPPIIDLSCQLWFPVVVVAFSSLAWTFGRRLDHSCSTCAFFFKVEVNLLTLIPFFRLRSVHSGLVSWDDCGKMWARKSPYPHQNTAFLLSLKENYWASLLPYTISRLMSTLALHQDVIFSQQTAPKGLNTSWKLDLFNTILLPVCFTYMLYSY